MNNGSLNKKLTIFTFRNKKEISSNYFSSYELLFSSKIFTKKLVNYQFIMKEYII